MYNMTLPFQIGLKLHSTNIAVIPYVSKLKKDSFFDYVELFIVPGSYEKTINVWKDLSIPYVIHAPHSYSGLNLSLGEHETQNRSLIEETNFFRIALKPLKTIFHPGINGSVIETIRQILLFQKYYPKLFELAVIENKPKIGLNGEVCIGATPQEIGLIIKETGIGFCLDIGHAIYFSAWADQEYEKVIESFNKLQPDIYHLSDGLKHSKTDLHLNFGMGNFELSRILKTIPLDSYVTIETNRDMALNLKDYKHDIIYLEKLLKDKNKLNLRSVTMEDSDILLKWRNDSQTRKASINVREVKKEEHVQWLHDALQNKNRKIYLAEKNGELVGTVRADYVDLIHELSWTIAPNMRGGGLGNIMVAEIVNQLATKVTAKIKKENKASIRIAEYVGMVFEKEEQGVLYYYKDDF